jgi:hypothetical protein
MTTPNEELVQKAVIVADDLAAAGKLNPVQSDTFLDYVVDETMLKDNARIVKFTGESLVLDKLGLGKRVSVPAQEAVDPGVRRGVNTSKVTLIPKEIMTPWEIGDTFKEINIEGAKVEDHIAQLMARQSANDVEEWYLNGDVLGPAINEYDYKGGGDPNKYVKDGLWALASGWFRIGDGGHVTSFAGQNIGSSVFGAMIRAMPTKWRRDLSSLRWFMSPDLLQLFYEKLATRGTALGDKVIMEGANGGIPIMGVKPVGIPLFPLYPKIVEHVVLPAAPSPVALRYKPLQAGTEIVTPETLDSEMAVTPFVGGGTDYTMDYDAGTIENAGGAIGSGDTVKVTYYAMPQILLTHMDNMIVGMSRDVRIEKDRDIFRRVNQYATTMKVDVQCEETDAIVKGVDIGVGI